MEISNSVMFFVNAVIAVATAGLLGATIVLAIYTRKMAEMASQPHIVATIEPNRWALSHRDLKVANTGNAAAYEISVSFDPPPKHAAADRGRLFPLQNISALRPGQVLTSYLGSYEDTEGITFGVIVKWKRHPLAKSYETLSYDYNMDMYNGLQQVGASDPLIQIAQQIKLLRDDWNGVAEGSRKIKTEVTMQENIKKKWEESRMRVENNEEK